MRRHDLEHIIRASTAITGVDEWITVGSQSVLGQYPDAPQELLISVEADLYAPKDAAAADLVEGSIGEGSPFHEAFGYYVHGVDPDTAVLPTGWEKRLRRVATGTWPSWRHSCGIEWRMPSCCARGWRKRRSTNASDESVSHVSARLRAGRCVTAWTAPR